MTVTLGLEEELQVVDALTGALAPFDVERAKRALPEGSGGVTCEIHKCTVELQSPVASHPDDIVKSLSQLRDFARGQATQHGQRVMAAGLHPYSPWQTQAVHDQSNRYPHYAHLLHEYGEVTRSAMSFGLHVHLGLPDTRFRIPVMNALRSILPEVLALSVNSPFHEGRDTGLASWRHSLLGRYPRMGIPEAWPDEQSYFAHIERLRKVGSLEPDQGMWDDLRLHHRYGTLEVRICDAVYSLERIWLIVALLQCEAVTLTEEAARGRLPEPEPRALIEENKWRARRYGMGALLVDWSRDEALPTPVRFERWLARLLPAALKLGLWPRIEMAVASALQAGTGADQQRVWRSEGATFEGLVKTLVDATAEPWIVPPSIGRRRRDIHKSPEIGKPARQPGPAPSAHLRTGRATP
ncbi:MAG: YbdK family carboxylate-amine ligase [Rhizomicrobium sp.]|jgi:carboxylate-amine ligase